MKFSELQTGIADRPTRKISFGLKGTLESKCHTVNLSGAHMFGDPSPRSQAGLPKVYAGDTIGCGLDWKSSQVFFTMNGLRLGKFPRLDSLICFEA